MTAAVLIAALCAASPAGSPEVVIQSGHDASIVDAAFTPDGAVLASLDANGLLVLWDVRARRVLRQVSAHAGNAGALDVSPDGRLVATTGSDKTVRVFDLATGALVREFPGSEHASTLRGSVAFLDDATVLAIVDDARWERCDLRSRTCTETSLPDGSITLSPDRRRYAIAQRNDVLVGDTATGKTLQTLHGHSDGIRTVAFSPSGARLVTTGFDETVRIWDAATGKTLREEPIKYPQAGAFLSEDAVLVQAASDAFRVPVAGGEPVPFGNRSYGGLFSLSPTLIAVVRSSELALFSRRTGAEAGTLAARSHAARELVLTPDGRWLIYGALGELKLVNLETGRFERRLADGDLLTLSPDGTLLARSPLRSPQGEHKGPVVRVTRLPGDEPAALFELAPELSLLQSLTFSPDGQTLLAAGQASQGKSALVALSPAAGRTLWRAQVPGDVYAAAFSPDGKTIALSRMVDGRDVLDLFDAAKKRIVRTAQGGGVLMRYPLLSASQVQFSKDGSRVLVRMATLPSDVEGDPYDEAIAQLGAAPVLGPFNERVHLWSTKELKLQARCNTGGAFFAADGALWTVRREGPVLLNAQCEEVRAFRGGAPLYLDAAVSADGQRVAATGVDGRVTFWDVTSGREVLNVLTTDFQEAGLQAGTLFNSWGNRDAAFREYVVFTPEGHYLASANAGSLVAFRAGTRTFGLRQFDAFFNRPDVILRALGRTPGEVLERALATRLRRQQRLGVNPDAPPPLPSVEVHIDRASAPEATDSRTLTLSVRAKDAAAGIAELFVTVNGTPVPVPRGGAANGKDVTRKIPIELSSGPNRIAAWARSANGLESLADEVTVTCSAQPASARLWLIAIGVSKYWQPGYDLTYASKDAADLAAFAKVRTAYEPQPPELILLQDEQATLQNLQALKERLARTGVDDRVVLSFSGHGVLTKDGQYYFAPHDMDFDAPEKSGLSYDALEALIAASPSRKKLLLLDTCHAGELEKDAKWAAPGQKGAIVRAVTARGAKAVMTEPLGGAQRAELLDGLFADLRRGSGAAVIAAAGGAEYALEAPQWKNGVFTRSVLSAWEHLAADTNADGSVSVSELREFVSARVQELTRGSQRPVSRRENVEFDFAAF